MIEMNSTVVVILCVLGTIGSVAILSAIICFISDISVAIDKADSAYRRSNSNSESIRTLDEALLMLNGEMKEIEKKLGMDKKEEK